MKKKILSILLAIVTLISITACGAKKDELVGTWTFQNDVKVDGTRIAYKGSTITFYEDNSFEILPDASAYHRELYGTYEQTEPGIVKLTNGYVLTFYYTLDKTNQTFKVTDTTVDVE